MTVSLKMLALETTDAQGGVALCDSGEIVAFRSLPLEARSARSLAPAIRCILAENGWMPNDVGAVAVAVGPGSFTGLRVGVATAKMFAWAVGARFVGVDSLEAIATGVRAIPTGDAGCHSNERNAGVSNVRENGAILSVGLDAQRGDAVVRRFWAACDGSFAPISLDERFRLVSLKNWLNVENQPEFNERFDWVKNAEDKSFLESDLFLNNIKSNERKDVYFCGSALFRRNNNDSEMNSNVSARFVDEIYWNPTAIGVAEVAWRRIENDDFDDVWRAVPIYSRKAAAEERILEKQNKGRG